MPARILFSIARTFSWIPIEAITLIACVFLSFVVILIFSETPLFLFSTARGFARHLIEHLFQGFFSDFFALVALYFFVRNITNAIRKWVPSLNVSMWHTNSGQSSQDRLPSLEKTYKRARTLRHIAPFLFYVFALTAMVSLVSWAYRQPSVDMVMLFTRLYTDWDIAWWGPGVYADLINTIGALPVLEISICLIYLYLSVLIGFWALFLLCYRTSLIREYMCTFFLGFFFALPLWLLTPAISPSQYMRDGIIPVAPEHTALSERIDTAVEDAGSVYRAAIGALDALWANHTSLSWYAISSQPSMHVAWGVMFVWYGWLVRRWVGVLFGVLQVGNMVGTVYLLQHYSIDVLTGLCIGILAIIMTRVLFSFEKRYMAVDEAFWFPAFVILQRESRFLVAQIPAEIRYMYQAIATQVKKLFPN